MSQRHHLIISGTGRAGTTLLVQLLTELGLETGFQSNASVDANCNAGLEWDIRRPDAPYVVKSPWLCDSLGPLLQQKQVSIDHALIPIRDLFSAAQSRREVTRRAGVTSNTVAGGLWSTPNPESQEAVLAVKFHALMQVLIEHDVPTTLLAFPRFTHEPEYLYTKLAPLLPTPHYNDFLRAFRLVCRPELVHDFSPTPDSGS